MSAPKCEECGRSDIPLMIVVFTLKSKDKPHKGYADSITLCEKCLNEVEQRNETSPTIH